MDRVLAAQHMRASDLLPTSNKAEILNDETSGSIVPIVAHATAIFEPYIRQSQPSAGCTCPTASCPRFAPESRIRAAHGSDLWPFASVPPMPSHGAVAFPDGIVLIDRHYNSLMPYRPNRPNLYAVRNGSHLTLRYLDFRQPLGVAPAQSRLPHRIDRVSTPTNLPTSSSWEESP